MSDRKREFGAGGCGGGGKHQGSGKHQADGG
jgi:hypothetical protein